MNFHRRSIRLSPRDYRGFARFFITTCCAGHEPLLTSPSVCHWLIDLLRAETSAASFLVMAYCFMPDHLHLLLESGTSSCNLIRFIKFFKQKSGYSYQQKTNHKLWQRHFYDHILREPHSPASVAWYIWLNPVRAGLCATAQEYPYSGSFTSAWPQCLAPSRPWNPPWRSTSVSGAKMAT
jgi:REP element-mobilizing transposase RayT